MFEVDPKERKRALADQGGNRKDIYVPAIKKSVQKRHQITMSRNNGG